MLERPNQDLPKARPSPSPPGESERAWGETARLAREKEEKAKKKKASEGSGIFGRDLVFEPDGKDDPRERYDPD